MKISIRKKNGRSRLLCTRADGSFTFSETGPDVPLHDIAHFIVEKELNLKKGFYGNIALGHSIEQLSDRDVIRTLGAETWIAEIVTRALQSLFSGACAIEDFGLMIEQELTQLSISFPKISDPERSKRCFANTARSLMNGRH
jgi:hypothetical protein